jgi:peptide/nickel transport system substrate-binding protein
MRRPQTATRLSRGTSLGGKRRLGRAVAISASLTAIALPMALAGPASGAAQPKHGGNLVVARNSNVTTLDPLQAVETDTIYSLDTIFQTLLYASADGKSERPGLALSVTPSADHLSWTVTLRHGVTFSNGQPMTAADVKFSLDRARTSSAGLGYLLAPITAVTVVDAFTVTLTTAQPVANMPALLTLWSGEIIPNNYAGQTETAFFKDPIGTGPFILKSWVSNGKMTVVRNPHYWESGKPYLNSITWEPVTDDSARVNQLEGGQAQLIQEVPYSSISSLQSASNVTVKTFPSTLQQFLMMNTKYAPFADPKVRQAVAYAINNKSVAKATLFGNGATACSILPPSMAYYAKVPCPAYNLTKAKALMAASSYPKGFPLSLLSPAGSEAATTAQVAQAELAKIGIKVTIRTVQASDLYTVQTTGNFQMIWQGWASDIPDPDEQLSFMLDPGVGGTESYYTYYSNPTILSLLASARGEFDPSTRAADYKQVQSLTATDGPYVSLTFEPWVDAWSNKMHGMNQLPTGTTFYQDIWISG